MNLSGRLESRTSMTLVGSWDIGYAKFFTFPISSTSSSSSLLRPLCSGAKQRLKGIWVPCSSPDAVVDILINNTISLSQPTLLVSLHGIAFEEHYVSSLNYVWPRGESSKTGTKVIFACFRDKMGQVQKFAMRFSSSDECQKFMEVLKCLKNGSQIHVPGAMQSNWLTEGIKRERINSRQSVPAPEIADAALPDTSFIALLAGCFTTADPGVPQASPEIDLKGFLSAGNKADKPVLDLLEKLDNIIVGLGGDLRF